MKKFKLSVIAFRDYTVISYIDYVFVTDPPEITVHPEAGPKTEGKEVVLSCDADGNPVPIISWTRDGSLVNTSGRFSFSADKKQLTITNVKRTDSGKYRCVASNKLGNDTSNVTTLDVQCKYSILLSTFLK